MLLYYLIILSFYKFLHNYNIQTLLYDICDAPSPNIGASYVKRGVPQASKILLRFFFFFFDTYI